MSVKVECAWARVCIRETKSLCSIKKAFNEGKAKFGARVLHERYQLYSEHFSGHAKFNLTQYEFNRVARKIDEQIANWRNKKDKELYLSQFSMTNWSDQGKMMTSETRKAHSITYCKACQLYNSQYQAAYPLKKMSMLGKRGPLTSIATDSKKHTLLSEGLKATKKQLKSVGQTIYSTYNEKCKENFGKTLREILVLVPDAGLQRKLSPVEKKKEKRNKLRQTKRDVENRVLMENDTGVHLNLRESYNARQQRRLAQSFETPEQAQERASTTPPKIKERSHIPALENIAGDIDQLLIDINSWPHEQVNWSEKARVYKIRYKGQDSTPPNGGQILKTLLQKTQGVNLANFDKPENKDGPKEFRVRRALKKQAGGEISVPVPRTNEKIRASIKQLIEDGTYDVGVPVVQTEIVKLAISNEGEVIQKKTNVSARKIPLQQIRSEALVRNKDLLRIKDDSSYDKLTREEIMSELKRINETTGDDTEEMRSRLKKLQRQRHWLTWHDHSTVANHGHMLFCVRELYDNAIHLSTEEFATKTGRSIDIQATIEEPQLYILGPSRSTVEDQMQFVPTRQEDLKKLKDNITTESGIGIKDVMRFMNGDNPAAEMEDGTQHGGHYGCPGCDGDINFSCDMEYSFQRKYKTLEEKKNLITAGPAGRKNSLHPFKDLKVNELKAELRARGMSDEGKKNELQKELAEVLGGTTRLPALLHHNASVQDLNLEMYEVLCFEPLHCLMNHIKNILQELPHHITDIDTLIKLKEILSVQLGKEKLRGVDYRKTLLYVTIALYPLANREVKLLLVTLCEMAEIYYSQDEKRCPKMILRLHNLCWRHAIQCRRVLTPPKSLSYRKLFGLYFHSCITHSSQLLRITSHRSINAEMFERFFEKISDITSKTWSRRIQDLPKNAILHVKQDPSKPGLNYVLKEEREISKLAKSLPRMGNTFVPTTDLMKYAGDWEAHLKLIADYLEPGEGVWWKEVVGGIEFLDGHDETSFREEGPQLHHFRSSTIKKEQQHLDTSWNKCLESKVKIPATKLRDAKGKWHVPETCYCSGTVPDDEDDNAISTEQMIQLITEDSDVGNALADDEDNMDGEAFTTTCDIESEEEQMAAHQEMTEEMHGSVLGDDKTRGTENVLTAVNKTPTTAEEGNKLHGKRPYSFPEVNECTPETKKKKNSDETNNQQLNSKTAKALCTVLGPCEEVLKYDKLRENLRHNSKSRFHIERYETHLVKIQIAVLKAFKHLSSFLDDAEEP